MFALGRQNYKDAARLSLKDSIVGASKMGAGRALRERNPVPVARGNPGISAMMINKLRKIVRTTAKTIVTV
jgi:hypothetical protein